MSTAEKHVVNGPRSTHKLIRLQMIDWELNRAHFHNNRQTIQSKLSATAFFRREFDSVW